MSLHAEYPDSSKNPTDVTEESLRVRSMENCEQVSSELERSTPDPSQTYRPLGVPSMGKVVIAVEVCLKSQTTVRHEEIRLAVERMLDKRSLVYEDGPIPIYQSDEPFLFEHVQNITICDAALLIPPKLLTGSNQTYLLSLRCHVYGPKLEELVNCTLHDGKTHSNGVLLFWQVSLKVYVYQACQSVLSAAELPLILNEDGPGEELDGNDYIATFHEWILPAREFHGLWESLIYDSGIKEQLVRYTETALLFSDKGVNPNLVSGNRVVLLHGPPGTGKTSICKALGQKLAIRYGHRYPQSQLVEVNAHSLFSKWFSESGKQVTKLFQKIQDIVEDGTTLVFVLIDEVESLTAARQAAVSGAEPSDSIRVVNALLTQLDLLKAWPNVIFLTTSNLTAAIDIAFLDRADIKVYIGPPSLQARYEILKSCLKELRRVGIIYSSMWEADEPELLSFKALLQKVESCSQDQRTSHSLNSSKALLTISELCEGLSGRALRKLPFLAHGLVSTNLNWDYSTFLAAMHEAVKKEISERALL